MRRIFYGLAMVAAGALATPASADGLTPGTGYISELKLGALYHDAPGLWSGFQVENTAVDPNFEILFRPLTETATTMLRPAIGATINPDGQTSHGYADIRFQVAPIAGFYFALGIGAAFNNGETGPGDANRKWLGSQILFHPSAEIGLNLDAHNNISVFFEHMSNANLATYNEGMDDIGLRYGYRF